jgi:serine/threonine protein kinase
MTKTTLIKKVKTAKHAEDIFGDEADVKTNYREFAKLLHPDKNPNDKDAAEAFAILSDFYGQAELLIAHGKYGDPTAIVKPIKLATKKAVYTITSVLAQGDFCTIYDATSDVEIGMSASTPSVIIKVVRSPANNDLLANEAKQLTYMKNDSPMKAKPVMKHVPQIVDSFILNQGKVNKQIVVLRKLEDHVSLADVMKAFPNGLELADAAWMFNRLLAALMAVHQSDLVHAAVLPSHFMIHPASHNGVLIDWSYSVAKAGTVKAISPGWKTFYPDEILDKRPATFGTDLFMAANVFTMLIGGDYVNRTFPATLPKPIQGLMRACWLGQRHRSSDAFELFEDFRKALQDTFGKPKFRPFVMPVAAAA